MVDIQRCMLLCVIVRRVSTECHGVTRPSIVAGCCVVQYLALVECTHACLYGLFYTEAAVYDPVASYVPTWARKTP
jgi:hypothetical protein